MKFLLLFMFVAVALADQESGTSQEIVARSMTRVFRTDPVDSLECAHKSEVVLEDLQYMENVIDVTDTEATDMKRLKRASCAIVCCAQKLGIMVGVVVQEEELFKFFKRNGIPEGVEVQMRDVVRICKEQVTDTSDECMVGYKFIKCVFNRSRAIMQYK